MPCKGARTSRSIYPRPSWQRATFAAESSLHCATPGSNPRLCLELTERAVTEDEDAFVAELAGLKALGVSLALDDFGAGRTSLGQLRHLPLDIVKIDRGFVNRLTNEEDDVVIVSAIVGLAPALGLTVVAEGVERPEQLPLLRDLGCDVGQGYLFARPQDISCFLERPAATFGR